MIIILSTNTANLKSAKPELHWKTRCEKCPSTDVQRTGINGMADPKYKRFKWIWISDYSKAKTPRN